MENQLTEFLPEFKYERKVLNNEEKFVSQEVTPLLAFTYPNSAVCDRFMKLFHDYDAPAPYRKLDGQGLFDIPGGYVTVESHYDPHSICWLEAVTHRHDKDNTQPSPTEQERAKQIALTILTKSGILPKDVALQAGFDEAQKYEYQTAPGDLPPAGPRDAPTPSRHITSRVPKFTTLNMPSGSTDRWMVLGGAGEMGTDVAVTKLAGTPVAALDDDKWVHVLRTLDDKVAIATDIKIDGDNGHPIMVASQPYFIQKDSRGRYQQARSRESDGAVYITDAIQLGNFRQLMLHALKEKELVGPALLEEQGYNPRHIAITTQQAGGKASAGR